MSQVERFKAGKARPAYKARRAVRELRVEVRNLVNFNRDCDAAYVALIARANAHNVARGVYAERPPPLVH